jgi:AraC-like DNA-binding protein
MPGSIRSAYSEPEEFQTALRAEGCLSLLITEPGQFRAQLTQISLVNLHISAVEENLSRIAFFEIPTDLVLISFPIGSATAPIWSGIKMQSEDFLIFRSGEKSYARTEGLTRWATIRVPLKTLIAYGIALTGAAFTIPSISRRWNPPRLAGRHLRSLHSAAIRMAANRPQLLVNSTAARGLEQQLLHATLECLTESRTGNEVRADPQEQEVMAAFQEVLEGKKGCPTSMAEICAALRISSPLVRRLCSEHLGMRPNSYDRLRRISLVRRTLEHGGSATICVTAIAYKNGFRDIRRFMASYRAAFGESPYTTLQRSKNL